MAQRTKLTDRERFVLVAIIKKRDVISAENLSQSELVEDLLECQGKLTSKLSDKQLAVEAASATELLEDLGEI